ncbi:conjugal transfer protein TrbL family protein [Nonomuraea insulae]|uniref:Conjugal transfer protein TrbL family protein n=1 Tax=Nonomuraea insulae TaxID=1616787 RepID=A0ABW1D070_9ACTN
MSPTAHMAIAAAAGVATLAATASAAVATPSPTPSPIIDNLPLPGRPGTGTSLGLNIGDWIIGQINHWFAELVAMAIQPLLELLTATLLTTPNLSEDGRVFDVWKATAAIANASFLLLLTIGAIAVMGYETVQTRYAIKEVLPRVAIAVVVTNTSYLVCGRAIELADALSQALLGEDFDRQRAATTLRSMLLPNSAMTAFYNLLAMAGIILLILLLITFIKRAALVILLVVAAPLALACHALPYTEGLARFWWRAFGGLLVIQVAQSLTLVLAVRIFFNQEGRLLLGVAPSGQLVNLLLALCLLIILVRIPGWISRRIFAQARGGHGGRGGFVARTFKYAIAYKLTSPVLNALHLGRGGRGGKKTTTTKRAATATLAGKVLPAVAGGPAGTAAATAATAAGRGTRAVDAARTGASRTPGRQGWTPPDPNARVAWGSSTTPQAHQRWSNPAQRWTPPDSSPAPGAGAVPRRPIPSTSRPMAITPPAATAWVPPDDKRPSPPPARGQRPRRRGGEER